MSRTLSFVVFLSIVLTITGALHYYLWARLVRDAGLPTWLHRSLTGVAVLLYLSFPITFWLSRALPPHDGQTLLLVLWSWLGFLFLLFVLLVIADVGRLAYFGVSRVALGAPVDAERRQTLARLLAGGVALAGFGLGVVGVVDALTRLLVKEVRIKLGRLPAALSGTTIVQLSDVHIGPTLRREFLAKVVARTNELQPDVVVITGDLVDGSVESLAPLVEPLRELKARFGVYFVTGNHEYYSGAPQWCDKLGELGVRVLRNERVSIGDSRGSYDLAGVDDLEGRRHGGGHGADLEKALRGRDRTRELVLLAHQPRMVFEAMRHGVGLQLSGHTHGGQLWPWRWFVLLQQPVIAGLARFGQTQVYVNSGTGYWGPPMRLGVPAEITKVILERE
jgi:predicted MPP superfamily phosphohydrolase